MKPTNVRGLTIGQIDRSKSSMRDSRAMVDRWFYPFAIDSTKHASKGSVAKGARARTHAFIQSIIHSVDVDA